MFVENGGIKFALPGFALCDVVVCYSKKVVKVILLPFFKDTGGGTSVGTADEILGAACLVFQEQRCHFAREVKKVRFVECSVNNQIALDFIVHSHIVRDSVRFLDEVGEDYVSEHFGVQFLLMRVVADEDFHEETVDHHGFEPDERFLFLHPFQAEPLFQFWVREEDGWCFKRVCPGIGHGVDHFIGEIFKIKREF